MPPRIIHVDQFNQERIAFVSQPAMAGYLTHYNDSDYIKQLPTYSIPGFTNGTYRIFCVDGDSMEPTLVKKDIIICEYIETFADLKNGEIYVIVSKDGILVKRCISALEKSGVIITKSDNPAYEPDAIPVDDILEVWKYRAKISHV